MTASFISEITALFEDETDINILFLLDLFGPLNLEKMSEMLQKPKSTIYGHLNKLIKSDQILLDTTTTLNKRGKFYTISPRVQALLNTQEEIAVTKEMIQKLDVSKQNFLKRIANVQKSIGFQASLLAKLSANYLEKQIDALNDLDQKSNRLKGFYAGIYELQIDTPEKVEEFRQILSDFSQQLNKFEMKDRTKRNTIVVLQTCPIDKLDT